MWALLLALFLPISSPVFADFDTGLEAYQRGDYATALKEWRLLADAGDDLDLLAERLKQAALDVGGPDNVTLVVVCPRL